MRNIFLLAAIIATGCVNTSVASRSESLRQNDSVREGASPPIVVTTPRSGNLDLTADEEIVDLPYDYINTCICEYEGWHENGLICLGIRCTPECSPEVTSCNERRRACVPDM